MGRENIMDNTILVRVENEMADKFWDKVKPMFMPTFKYINGEYDIEDLRQWIQEDAMQLWLVMDRVTNDIIVAGVTEVVIYPKIKVARIVTAGGKNDTGFYDFIPEMAEHCKRIGCDYLESQVSREGMVKKLEKNGFEKFYTTMRKKTIG